MTCGSSIKITKLKVDKDMNVYIKAQEKPTSLKYQCNTGCSSTATIYLLRKVNSVTVVKEDGTKLGKCA